VNRAARVAGVTIAGGILLAVTLVLLAPAVAAVLSAHKSAPVQDINLEALSQRSRVLDAHGRLITYLYREENRQVVPLGDIPLVLVDSVLQVEDVDFFQHSGVDVRSIGRAFLTNVEAGGIEQGGSTITQQLVKNALLDPKQDIHRKMKEAVLAVRLEHTMSKTEILERYLNTVYLGNGTYGVEAAAELYFGVSAKQLDRAQSAFLAGIIRNPVGYDPYVHPDEARRRRDLVADVLERRHRIKPDEANAIRATPIPARPFQLVPKPKDYFVQEVISSLLEDKRLGATQSERYTAIFRGGLKIRTTFDPAKQQLATAAVSKVLPDTGGRFTAAVVSVEPGTGAVRAMVGGPGFETAKYNIATQGIGRQPGSSFKPFVLATALEEGISPKSTINASAPCSLPNEGGTPNPWKVDNYEGSRGGVMDLYTATKKSMNCAYARLALIVGIDHVADTAKRLGITTPLPHVPSMALGSLEVRPIDMAAAYASFANDGVYAQPYLVDEILDRDGRSILKHEPETHRAVSPETARFVDDILNGVIQSGTGTRAKLPDGRPAAGKTGTTSDYADAWFVGYTPQLSTAVWMGSPSGTADKMKNVGGIRVTGGSYPARIWEAYMAPAMDGLPKTGFLPPPEAGKGTYLHITGEPDRKPATRRTTTTSTPESTPPGNDQGAGGDGRVKPGRSKHD